MSTDHDGDKRTVKRYPNAIAAGDFEVIQESCTTRSSTRPARRGARSRGPRGDESPIHEAFPNFDVTVRDLAAEPTGLETHDGP